jgi:hypothetical protein
MRKMICPDAQHAAIKADDATWSAQPLLGVQRGEDGDPDVEVRQCSSCRTTLGRDVPVDSACAPARADA